MTGRNGASGEMCGKREDAGVIHSGRNGLTSAESAYDESCGRNGKETIFEKSADPRAGTFTVHVTYCEAHGPAIESRGDLDVLLRADGTRRRVQVRRGVVVVYVVVPRVLRLRICLVVGVGRDDGVRRGEAALAQAESTVDNGAPDGHRL
jgi:hypothetical protein